MSRSQALTNAERVQKKGESDKLNVLSLFDGISCGMVALERAGIDVEDYFAYEIEKNAIKVSENNYPNIKQCGDVTTADFSQYKGIDLLIGGSPCQSLSIVRSQDREHLDGKSKLFFEYVRALKIAKPKYFLFENVASMNNESKQIISGELGCDPILINSNAFSAQDRPRLYWTNIPINDSVPEECELTFNDIKQQGEIPPKYYYYDEEFTTPNFDKQVCCQLLNRKKFNDTTGRVFNPDRKIHTLVACNGGHHQKKVLDAGIPRKLTPLEYERLQTLPDGYTDGVSDTARYSALGNGWTVDVIAWIVKHITI